MNRSRSLRASSFGLLGVLATASCSSAPDQAGTAASAQTESPDSAKHGWYLTKTAAQVVTQGIPPRWVGLGPSSNGILVLTWDGISITSYTFDGTKLTSDFGDSKAPTAPNGVFAFDAKTGVTTYRAPAYADGGSSTVTGTATWTWNGSAWTNLGTDTFIPSGTVQTWVQPSDDSTWLADADGVWVETPAAAQKWTKVGASFSTAAFAVDARRDALVGISPTGPSEMNRATGAWTAAQTPATAVMYACSSASWVAASKVVRAICFNDYQRGVDDAEPLFETVDWSGKKLTTMPVLFSTKTLVMGTPVRDEVHDQLVAMDDQGFLYTTPSSPTVLTAVGKPSVATDHFTAFVTAPSTLAPGFVDPNNLPLTATLTEGPAGASLVNGQIVYTPGLNDAGTKTFKIHLSDELSSATVTVTVDVLSTTYPDADPSYPVWPVYVPVTSHSTNGDTFQQEFFPSYYALCQMSGQNPGLFTLSCADKNTPSTPVFVAPLSPDLSFGVAPYIAFADVRGHVANPGTSSETIAFDVDYGTGIGGAEDVTAANVPEALAPAPVLDGAIHPGEYGAYEDGQNESITASGQSWYATYDANGLYLALRGANLSEAAVVYLTMEPGVAPGTGNVALGSTSGVLADGQEAASLPFYASTYIYAKDGDFETRAADGVGGWTAAAVDTSGKSYASEAATLGREIFLPWPSLTKNGKEPASFGLFAYATSASGYVYASAPRTNPSGSIGKGAAFGAYFQASTASAQLPFAQ